MLDQTLSLSSHVQGGCLGHDMAVIVDGCGVRWFVLMGQPS